MSQPGDIAGTVAWLLSADARGVTRAGNRSERWAGPGWVETYEGRRAAPLVTVPVAGSRALVLRVGRESEDALLLGLELLQLFVRAHPHRALEPLMG